MHCEKSGNALSQIGQMGQIRPREISPKCDDSIWNKCPIIHQYTNF